MKSSALDSLKFGHVVGEQRLGISEEALRKLLILASIKDAPYVTATANAFCAWVYGLEHATYRWIEKNYISDLASIRKNISNVLARHISGEVGEWVILSCDTNDPSDKIYRSHFLTIRNEPLTMKPDLVLKNETTGTVIVVEYKIPSQGIAKPKNGWPNLACQLWAYSWIDDWRDEPNVILVGALFNWNSRDQIPKLSNTLPRTLKTDKELNRACSLLFREWGGETNASIIKSKMLRSSVEW